MDSHGGLQQRRAASVEKEAGGVWEPFLEVNKERRGVWWICVGRGVKGFYTEAVQTQELCDFLLFFSLFEKPADVTDRPHKHCDSVTLGNV